MFQQERFKAPHQLKSSMSATDIKTNSIDNTGSTFAPSKRRQTKTNTPRTTITFYNPNRNKNGPIYCLPCSPSAEDKSLQKKISNISNIASMLCVLDCTVLPIITFLLPLFGVATSPSQAKTLHEIGHYVALFFVLPIGGLTATVNYFTHPNKSSIHNLLSLSAIIGLSLIYAANGGHHSPILSVLPHEVAHALHCNAIVHKAVNISGCAMLLGSSYLWHKVGTEDGGRCCLIPHLYGIKEWNTRVTLP